MLRISSRRDHEGFLQKMKLKKIPSHLQNCTFHMCKGIHRLKSNALRTLGSKLWILVVLAHSHREYISLVNLGRVKILCISMYISSNRMDAKYLKVGDKEEM